MAGLYFEEFEAGKTFEQAWSRTITEMDNMLFSCLTFALTTGLPLDDLAATMPFRPDGYALPQSHGGQDVRTPGPCIRTLSKKPILPVTAAAAGDMNATTPRPNAKNQ